MIGITKYNWEYSKESIIEKIQKNKSILKKSNGNTSSNTDELMFSCKEFDSIKTFVVDYYFNLKKVIQGDYSISMWSYTQTKDSTYFAWHKHLLLDGGRTSLETDFTFVFYLQIPKNIKKGEGDLLIIDETGLTHTIVPKEGDIVFFNGNLLHVPTPTPDAEMDRISIAGNISSLFLSNRNVI
jgi:hypothetical protein